MQKVLAVCSDLCYTLRIESKGSLTANSASFLSSGGQAMSLSGQSPKISISPKKTKNKPLLLTSNIHNNTMQIAIYQNTAVLVSNIKDYEGTATVTFDNGKEKTVPVDQIQFR